MVKNDWMKTLLDEFGGGIRLAKCRRCGCMRGALEAVATGLTGKKEKDALMLRKKAIHWLEKAEPERYT